MGKNILNLSCVIFAFFLTSQVVWAEVKSEEIIKTKTLDIPAHYIEHLPPEKLNFVLDFLNNKITVYTPQQIFSYLGNNVSKVLSAGYNGIAVKTDRVITKVSFHGMLSTEQVWSLIPVITQSPIDIPKIHTTADNQKIAKELLGHLIWMTYDKSTFAPISVSSDFQAMQKHYEHGRPLNDLLKSNEYHEYDKTALWKEVIRIQNLAERMLLETGLIVDLVNPGNFIVSGGKEKPFVSNIDFELMRPSQETVEYYKAQRLQIPEIKFSSGEKMIAWPHIPEAILVSSLWKLTYEQSLDYIKAKYDIVSTMAAVRVLANTPKYKNSFLSEREFFENIDLAAKNTLSQTFTVGACRNYL